MSEAILEFRDVNKRFGGTKAVDNISLELHPGEIVALLGENGAGKSTLIKLLAGVHTPDSGDILVQGQSILQKKSEATLKQSVAFIHQDLGLVEWMTVAENVALGMGWQTRAGFISWAAADRAAIEVMKAVGCDIAPDRRVFSLTRAEKSLLAIGRALQVKAKILVLDEPTASLPMADVERLLSVLRKLRQEGIAMLYVSHRLEEVLSLSDRCAVMRDGKMVGVKETAQINQRQLVEMIVGKDLGEAAQKASSVPSTERVAIAQLRNAASGNAGPVSMDIRKGEILGLVGLRGAGQEAIAKALFGRESLSSGEFYLQGQKTSMSSPSQAIASGIGYVAADRLEENLAANLTVLENLFPHPVLLGHHPIRVQGKAQERQQAMGLIEALGVNPASPDALIQQLSGGNQQKVVLARWFNLKLPMMVLEEPTAGVDVGAKQQIYKLVHELAKTGCAVVVMSTDFEEVAAICDRVLVFRNGLIEVEHVGDAIHVPGLLASALGGVTDAQAT